MKTKQIAILAVLLMASITLSSFVALTAATPGTNNGKSVEAHKKYSNFSLEATGTATDMQGDEVDVAISISGKANGKEKTVFHMRAQGEDVTIESYDTIAVTKGQGIIVNKNNFIHLNLMLSGTYYGGRSTLWILRGTTGDLQDDSLTVDLTSRRVVLPVEGYPQLTNLKLEGTITFT